MATTAPADLDRLAGGAWHVLVLGDEALDALDPSECLARLGRGQGHGVCGSRVPRAAGCEAGLGVAAGRRGREPPPGAGVRLDATARRVILVPTHCSPAILEAWRRAGATECVAPEDLDAALASARPDVAPGGPAVALAPSAHPGDLHDALALAHATLRGALLAEAGGQLGSREEAEDVVQQVLLALCKRPADAPPIADLHAYLRRAVRHEAANARRRAARTMAVPAASGLGLAAPESWHAALVRFEERVATAPDLTLQQRAILEFRHVHGMSLVEAAACLRISVAAAGGRYRAALAALRRANRPAGRRGDSAGIEKK